MLQRTFVNRALCFAFLLRGTFAVRPIIYAPVPSVYVLGEWYLKNVCCQLLWQTPLCNFLAERWFVNFCWKTPLQGLLAERYLKSALFNFCGPEPQTLYRIIFLLRSLGPLLTSGTLRFHT